MRYILIIVAIACIWGGGQGIYTAMQNPNPVEYDLTTITGQNMPEEEWLTITNCNFDLTKAVLLESLADDELYIPLHSKNDSIIGFVALKEAEGYIKLFKVLINQTDDGKIEELIEEYKENIFQENLTYSGLVRYGIELDDKEKNLLSSNTPELIRNFIILDSGKSPSRSLSYFIFGVGLLILIVQVIRSVKSK